LLFIDSQGKAPAGGIAAGTFAVGCCILDDGAHAQYQEDLHLPFINGGAIDERIRRDDACEPIYQR
jgi:hypothetical protein